MVFKVPTATIDVLNDPVLGVEQHDAEVLGRPRAECRQQERRRVARRAELHARARRVRQRPSSELQRGQKLCGLGRPDASELRQVARRRSDQRMEAAANFSSSLATPSALVRGRPLPRMSATSSLSPSAAAP